MWRFLILSRLTSPGQIKLNSSNLLTGAWALLVAATVGASVTAVLWPLVMNVDEQLLRHKALSMAVLAVALCGLSAQVLLKFPLLWLVDLRPLLSLPFSFTCLYFLRVAMSTVGLWVAALGPVGIYFAAADSASGAGVTWTLAGTLVLVWIVGRLATIISLAADYLVKGLLASLLLLVLLVAGYRGMHAMALSVLGPTGFGERSLAIPKFDVADFVVHTPFGWFSSIITTPRDTPAKISALGLMLGCLAVLMIVERQILLLDCNHRFGRRASEPSMGTRALAPLLRRLRHLPPSTVLWLAETRCVLQFRPVRLCILVCFAFGLAYAAMMPRVGLLFPVLFFCLFFCGVRSVPAASHVWSESLTLPLTVVDVFRTPGRSGDVLAGALLVCVGSVVLADGEIGWLVKGVSVLLAVSIVTFASAGLGVARARWPVHQAGVSRVYANVRADVASLVALLPAVAVQVAAFGLYLLDRSEYASAVINAGVGLGCLLAAVFSWLIARRWQSRFLERRGASHILGVDPIRFGSRAA